MKGIDIVYHADNNTMELKDAPDDLLIGTDGDDYATYLKFQIIDDEGILDGFSPYVLFEVESRPMIGLDESYTLNLTQDLLNKARYGKLPFMLVFKGKDSTIEIHSTNSLSLGIAHSIDADREVEDDSYDSELAIKYVEITYHAESRLMELTDMPDDQFVGTDGDDYATYLRFHMDDPDGLLTGYGARVEFDVSIKDENGDTYKPFIVIDESMSVPLIQRILSNVKYGAIPIQLAFKGTDSEGRSSQYYSLNKLRLSISDSIRALEGIDVNDRIDLNSVINNVEYNPKTATFSFRQIDGGTIAVQLSDLSEEHFEVSTKDDLKKLNKAQNGDTATTLDDGKWYKLYGEYSDPQSWKVMSPSVKAVDDHISDRDNPHNVTKSQIGLGNVDDTSDIDKPISTLTQEALNLKADSKDLSELSKIVSEEIADRESSEGIINESISNHVSDTNNPHNVTKEQLGLENVDNTSDINKPISTATQEALDDKADKTTVSLLSNTLTKEIQDRQTGDNTNATAISTHATNKSNPHGVTKEQVGLGNVDNTSDADKPISTATQNALNLKADKSEISALYRPKGSVATYNDLPSTAQIGDVYDVQSTGMNYVWTGSKWDELGAIIDLSPYYTKADVDSALSGKVSKSGDTMTGNLTLDSNHYKVFTIKNSTADVSTGASSEHRTMYWADVNGKHTGLIRNSVTLTDNAPRTNFEFTTMNYNEAGNTIYSTIGIFCHRDGTKYAIAPNWSVGTNDNSDKILTIKMANSLPSLCHSTGNETWSGVKTLSADPIVLKNAPSLICKDTKYALTDALPENWTYGWIQSLGKDGKTVGRFTVRGYTDNKRRIYQEIFGKDGTSSAHMSLWINDKGLAYAEAPNPDTGVSDKIATANWSIGKFVQKTGDTMTGNLMVNGDNKVIDVISTQITDQSGMSTNTVSNKFRIRSNAMNTLSEYGMETNADRNKAFLRILRLNGDTLLVKDIAIHILSDGTYFSETPSNFIGTNDNSDKSLTIKMANSLPSLVHTTGNETVAGVKSYTSDCSFIRSADANTLPTAYENRGSIYFRDNNGVNRGVIRCDADTTYTRTYISAERYINGTHTVGRLDLRIKSDGSVVSYAPQTPNGAVGTEIATANWTLGKFVALSGDQTIAGQKTFTTRLMCNAGVQTNGSIEMFASIPYIDFHRGNSTADYTSRIIEDSYALVFKKITNGVEGQFALQVTEGGSAFVSAPTPSDKADNSTKIPTTAWISTADCIVHKTGNETVGGTKTFTSNILHKGTNGSLNFYNTRASSELTDDGTSLGGITAFRRKEDASDGSYQYAFAGNIVYTAGATYNRMQIQVRRPDGTTTNNAYMSMYNYADGTRYLSIPSPPSSATGTESVTANWTLGKFVQKSGDTVNGTLTFYRYYPEIILKTNNSNVTTESGKGTGGYDYGYPIRWQGFDGVERARVQYDATDTGSTSMLMEAWDNAHTVKGQLKVVINNTSKEVWAIAPTPSDKVDNSSKIATTSWIAQTSLLVHTTSNETISGEKTFTSKTKIKSVSEYTDATYQTSPYLQFYQGSQFTGSIVTVHDTSNDNAIAIETKNPTTGKNAILRVISKADGTSEMRLISDGVWHKIATEGWSNGAFVKKTGDTMTGDFKIARTGGEDYLTLNRTDLPVDAEITAYYKGSRVSWRDSANIEYAFIHTVKDVGNTRMFVGNKRNIDGTDKTSEIAMYVTSDGTTYATAPTPSNKADNSTKIPTTAWISTADCIVHKTGNETVDGTKYFTSAVRLASTGTKAIVSQRTNYTRSTPPTSTEDVDYIRIEGSDGLLVGGMFMNYKADGSRTIGFALHNGSGFDRFHLKCDSHQSKIYATCPTTPTNATSNEIATADWVNDKLNNKIVASTTDIGEGSALATGTLYLVYE